MKQRINSRKQFNSREAEAGSLTRPALKIGDVAKASGIGIEALRFYEKSDLLDAPSRTGSGYRIYGRDVLDRLDFIKRAQLLGFSVDEIKRIIAHKRAGESPCSEVRQIVRRRLKEVDEKMREMKRYRSELASALEEWDQTGDVAGHVCGLIEHSHIKRTAANRRNSFNKRKR